MRKSYLIAACMTAGMALWLASGSLMGEHAEATPAPDTAGEAPARLPAVRVRKIEATSYSSTVIVRGRTEAPRIVSLRAEVSGQVGEILVQRGAFVKAGEVICRLSVRDRQAALVEAQAELRQREVEYNAAAKLQDSGYGTRTKFAEAQANLDAARSKVKRMTLELADTEIKAPFDGVIEDTPVKEGDVMGPGSDAACAIIVDINPMLIVGQVAEREVDEIAPGSQAEARLITGQTVTGKVRFVGSNADPQTRTFRIEVEVANADGALKSGVTTEIRLPTEPTLAHHISPAILNLDAKGVIGLKAIDENNVVSFVPVEIVGSDAGGVWVTGLPAKATVITVGQDYVNPGQKVEVAREDGKTS